jgi:hypothetical protein
MGLPFKKKGQGTTLVSMWLNYIVVSSGNTPRDGDSCTLFCISWGYRCRITVYKGEGNEEGRTGQWEDMHWDAAAAGAMANVMREPGSKMAHHGSPALRQGLGPYILQRRITECEASSPQLRAGLEDGLSCVYQQATLWQLEE